MKIKRALAALTAICAALGLSACSGDEAELARKDALKYYRDKYGDRDVEIKDGVKAGNNGLFGYAGVKDRAYTLTDGSTVYWDSEDGSCADDRQAREIIEALRTELIEPALARFPDASVSDYTINRLGFDSVDVPVFHNIYEGEDILAYASDEYIHIDGLEIVFRETADYKALIESFRDSLAPYADGHVSVGVFRESHTEALPSTTVGLRGDRRVKAVANLRLSGDGVDYYDNDYVEVYPGIFLCSSTANVSFTPEAVKWELWGTGSDLQRLLDEGYEALPQTHEANKNGYHEPDRDHISRVILGDMEGPVFRVTLSDELKEHLTGRGWITAYAIAADEHDDTASLPYGEQRALRQYFLDKPYELLYVTPMNAERGGQIYLMEEAYYYIGPADSEKE